MDPFQGMSEEEFRMNRGKLAKAGRYEVLTPVESERVL